MNLLQAPCAFVDMLCTVNTTIKIRLTDSLINAYRLCNEPCEKPFTKTLVTSVLF